MTSFFDTKIEFLKGVGNKGLIAQQRTEHIYFW